MISPETRKHYLDLRAAGEAKGLAGHELGVYVRQRMAPAELRELLADHYIHTDAARRDAAGEGRQHD